MKNTDDSTYSNFIHLKEIGDCVVDFGDSIYYYDAALQHSLLVLLLEF